jgi:hypothetical protein
MKRNLNGKLKNKEKKNNKKTILNLKPIEIMRKLTLFSQRFSKIYK